MKTRKLDLSGFIQNELSKEETLKIKGGDEVYFPTIPMPLPPLGRIPAPGPVVLSGNGAG
jgi:hypothetical protein